MFVEKTNGHAIKLRRSAHYCWRKRKEKRRKKQDIAFRGERKRELSSIMHVLI